MKQTYLRMGNLFSLLFRYSYSGSRSGTYSFSGSYSYLEIYSRSRSYSRSNSFFNYTERS